MNPLSTDNPLLPDRPPAQGERRPTTPPDSSSEVIPGERCIDSAPATPQTEATEGTPNSTTADGEPTTEPARRTWIQRVLDHKGATWFLSACSFLDSALLPIPTDVVMMAMCVRRPALGQWYAFLASIWSVIGGAFGYWIGMTLWTSGLGEWCFENMPGMSREGFEEVSQLYGSSGIAVVLLAAFTPLPYKVFAIAAGVAHAHLDFTTFMVASAAGRFTRFHLQAWLTTRYGLSLWSAMRRRPWTWALATLAVIGLIWLLL